MDNSIEDKLDYKQMLIDIDDLVDNDFGFDMDCKANLHDKPDKFTQEEALQMAQIIGDVYSISHGYNGCCATKYLIKEIESNN